MATLIWSPQNRRKNKNCKHTECFTASRRYLTCSPPSEAGLHPNRSSAIFTSSHFWVIPRTAHKATTFWLPENVCLEFKDSNSKFYNFLFLGWTITFFSFCDLTIILISWLPYKFCTWMYNSISKGKKKGRVPSLVNAHFLLQITRNKVSYYSFCYILQYNLFSL